MEPILKSCAGLDVHQETVVACILYGPLEGKPVKEIKTFGTTTPELLSLSDWLESFECTHVAMESTSVYWKPIWNILEGDFKLLLANAYSIKNVPGRKTDVKDSEWIAQLLRCGLIQGSFVPSIEIRDLRDLTRYRKKLISDQTAEKNRIHKILQDANIKMTTYISDLFGVSGRNLLQALMNGELITSQTLSTLVKGPLKKKIPLLIDALNGRFRQHHREMIQLSWEHLIYIESSIRQVEELIDQMLVPYGTNSALLQTIPGINHNAAAVLIAEIGTDMSIFPTHKHLASWAGVSPGNYESAGKKKASRTTPGNRALKSILCECAWSASMSRNTRLNAYFWRIAKRRGKKRALMATAHLLLVIAYYILQRGVPYQELGNDYLSHLPILEGNFDATG